jgi:hypothetical protein
MMLLGQKSICGVIHFPQMRPKLGVAPKGPNVNSPGSIPGFPTTGDQRPCKGSNSPWPRGSLPRSTPAGVAARFRSEPRIASGAIRVQSLRDCASARRQSPAESASAQERSGTIAGLGNPAYKRLAVPHFIGPISSMNVPSGSWTRTKRVSPPSGTGVSPRSLIFRSLIRWTMGVRSFTRMVM